MMYFYDLWSQCRIDASVLFQKLSAVFFQGAIFSEIFVNGSYIWIFPIAELGKALFEFLIIHNFTYGLVDLELE